MSKDNILGYGTGRRKSSVARVSFEKVVVKLLLIPKTQISLLEKQG